MIVIPSTFNGDGYARVTVFTASFPGIYKFVFEETQGGQSDSGGFSFKNSDGAERLLVNILRTSDRHASEFSIYLESGGELIYYGLGGSLYGVRLGDELA